MAFEIKIPVPDQTTEEVRIVTWRKNEGQEVTKDEIILEIETDKAVMEVEATGDGVLLKQLSQVDDMVPVGAVVGYIGQACEQIVESAGTAEASKVVKDSPKQSEPAVQSVSKGTNPDLVEIKIPVPDQTTEEVRIVTWRKNVGQEIAKDEIILEIETDKAVMEVEATGDGVLLKQLSAVDDMVPVGQVVGYIGPEGTEVKAEISVKTADKSEQPVSTAVVTSNAGVNASPLAKKIAGRDGIDLDKVKGTGVHDKIMRRDIESAKSSIAQPVTTVGGRIFASPNAKRLAKELGVDLRGINGTGQNGRIVGRDVIEYTRTKPVVKPAPVESQPQPGTEEPLTKMRRAIGLNLQSSFRDTPHFNATMSIDMTNAMSFRAELNKGKDKTQKVSLNDLVIKACSLALKEFPAVNSRFLDDRIQYLSDINVGVATAIDTGLVVPVVLNTDKLSWEGLAAETKRIIYEARNGKIIGAGKGTFTVSNLGMFGVDEFTAIINPPESAILAVGAVTEQVVPINGTIGIKSMMKVTLCSDHRIVDGALAAKFLQNIKHYLEEEIC